jgi:hypothetical protein
MRKSRVLAAFLVLVAAACEDPLTVTNTNAADRDRALARPSDVLSLISGGFNGIHSAHYGSATAVWPQALVMGQENYSALANFGMNVRGPIPRPAIVNASGSAGTGEFERDWNLLSRAARQAATGLNAFRGGLTLGNAGEDTRARMFAHFVMGVAMGDMALMYDQPTVISDLDSPEFIPPLTAYATVMNAAMARLDSAIANAATATFPLPSTWINGNAFSRTQFIAVARGYKARFRAGVARTPAERAAVDWASVTADANAFLAGMTTDFNVTIGVTGWGNGWFAQHGIYQAWHQMDQFMVGMGDTSGAYTTWLATARPSKSPFTVVTPDRRFPQGLDRPTQNTNSPSLPTPDTTGTGVGNNPRYEAVPIPYLRNRVPGQDVLGEGLGTSFYDHFRFQLTFNNRTAGIATPQTYMTRAEMRLLAAEAAIRASNWALAAALIDSTRVNRGRLPALTGVIVDGTTPVPGGNACVPKVPPGGSPNGDPNFTWAAPSCGNIFEALKWEKRLETAYAGWAMWYIDSRGWGDLPTNTAYHFPVPFAELDTRLAPWYSLGGGTFGASAARGTYGL